MSCLPPMVLNNGVRMPRLGLGTYLASGSDVKDGVRAALKAGIRAIDTANLYKNEAEIGQAIEEAGLSRDDVFITSKVSPYQQGTERATAAVNGSLSRLQTRTIDCMLIHWPGTSRLPSNSPENAAKRLETWRVLESFYEAGRCRAIGVSNFQERHLTELLSLAKVKPAVNQIEVHPRLPQDELRAACRRLGIAVIAYSPFGGEGAELLRHPTTLAVAQAARKTPAQVLIQWSIQQNNIVIPKSVQERHIQEWRASDEPWLLDSSAMKTLETLADGHRYCWDPSDVA